MFKSHSWKKPEASKPKNKKFRKFHKNMGDVDGDDMGDVDGFMDTFKSINDKYLKKPIQTAIDKNRAKLIDKATSSAVNLVGSGLSKVGGTDPKNLKAVQELTSSLTQGAVEGAKESVMAKIKPYLIWGGVGVSVIALALIIKKKKKSL